MSLRVRMQERWRTNVYPAALAAALRQAGASVVRRGSLARVRHYQAEPTGWRLATLVVSVGFWRLVGAKIVWTIHDLHERSRTFRYLAPRCDALIVHGEDVRERLASVVAPEVLARVRVLAHPIYEVEPSSASLELGTRSERQKLLLVFGDFRRHKSPRWFVETFAALPEFRDVRVVVAGRLAPDDAARLVRDPRVELRPGFVPDAEAARLFRAADWLVLPYAEVTTSGLVRQAAAYAVPCLASDLPHFRAELSPATGRLFRYGDRESLRACLREALAMSTAATQALGENLWRAKRAQTWATFARQHLEIYRELTAAPRRSHVLILVENLPVPFDRRVWMEATALVEAGFEVSVIGPKAPGFMAARETIEGVRVLRHAMPRERSSAAAYLFEYAWVLLAQARLAWRLWRERRFQLVHVCNPPDLLWITALPYQLLAGVGLVFDQHDLGPEMYASKFRRRDVFYWGLRLAERCAYALADRVIAPNESYRRLALSRGKKRDDAVVVVRSAPDLQRFRPRATAMRSGTCIGFLGIMGESDGLDVLVDVIEELVVRRGRAELRFRLIGDGPAFAATAATIAARGLAGNVEMLGRLHGDALLDALAGVDIGVCPDRPTPYSAASTMNKIMEYMAMAIPIVQFDLAENRVSAGDAALYAATLEAGAFADQVEILLCDPALREMLGARGLARMEQRLEWRHQKGWLTKMYAELATAKGAALVARTEPS